MSNVKKTVGFGLAVAVVLVRYEVLFERHMIPTSPPPTPPQVIKPYTITDGELADYYHPPTTAPSFTATGPG